MKKYYTDDFIDDIYKEIMNDETIKSVSEVASRHNIPYYQVRYLREALYKIYKKAEILSITRKRMGAYRFSKRIEKGPIVVSQETCDKMSASQKEYWKNAPEERYEIARQSHFEHRAPVSQTPAAKEKRILTRKQNNNEWHTEEAKEKIRASNTGKIVNKETRKKQSNSAIKRGNNLPIGFRHAQETKDILRQHALNQWESGVHKPRFKSKGHIEIEELLTSLEYKIISEFRIKSRPFDVLVYDYNIIIEFNGTYWHYDKRFYDKNYFDKYRGVVVKDVWEYDNSKRQLAIDSGYKVIIIWQYDWDKANNKIAFLKELLNETK